MYQIFKNYSVNILHIEELEDATVNPDLKTTQLIFYFYIFYLVVSF